jgi:hypothetical protein
MPDANATAKTEAAPAKKCRVEKCKRPVRAKLGKKHRYKICSKEGCRKPAVAGGVCAEHKKGAVAEGAAPAA